jgi:hypothetical protein
MKPKKEIKDSSVSRKIPIAGEYDVVVCGGGTSGFPAAIAAARQGAKVALIERYGFLGGVPAYSIMPCWHGLNYHNSGLLTEFAERVAEFGQGPKPLDEGSHIEPETVKILSLEMVLEAGVELHLHNMIVGTIKEGNALKAVVTESKSGRRAFAAKVIVDATGDGDVGYYAGAEFMKGNEGKMQAVTLRFRIGHIDFDRYFDWAERNPQFFQKTSPERFAETRKKAKEGKAFYMEADFTDLYLKYPEPHLPTQSYFNGSSIRPNELSVNGTRLHRIDGTVEEDLTKAEITCRRQAYALWKFVKKRIPGFEKSMIVDVPAQIGVRETRTIVGDYILTEEDCRINKRFDDSLLTAVLAFDMHDVDKYVLELLKGTVEIPYRAFLPKGIEGLIVVGRAFSSDHVTNSSIRKMESVFQIGQAGGTAAALAALHNLTPRDLPVKLIQKKLLEANVDINQDYYTGKTHGAYYYKKEYTKT